MSNQQRLCRTNNNVLTKCWLDRLDCDGCLHRCAHLPDLEEQLAVLYCPTEWVSTTAQQRADCYAPAVRAYSQPAEHCRQATAARPLAVLVAESDREPQWNGRALQGQWRTFRCARRGAASCPPCRSSCHSATRVVHAMCQRKATRGNHFTSVLCRVATAVAMLYAGDVVSTTVSWIPWGQGRRRLTAAVKAHRTDRAAGNTLPTVLAHAQVHRLERQHDAHQTVSP